MASEMQSAQSESEPGSSTSLPRSCETVLRVAALVLLLLGAAYVAKGAYHLVAHETGAGDLRLRWVDAQYVLAGQNPYDVFFLARKGIEPPPGRDAAALPELGAPPSQGYPPWTHFVTLPLLAGGWTTTRWLFLAVTLAAAGYVSVSTWRLIATVGGPSAATFAVSSFFATSALCTSLGLGQYGPLVLAALLGMVSAQSSQRPSREGLLLALAWMKPTLSGPYVFAYLFRRPPPWIVSWSFVAGLTAASVGTWLLVKTNPVEMLSQMLRSSSSYWSGGYDLLSVTLSLGMAPRLALLTAMAIGVGGALLLLGRARHQPFLNHVAICAVAGRLWTYHAVYDNVVVFVLFLATFVAWLERPTRVRAISWFAVGLSLWLPARCTDFVLVRHLQLVTWVVALVVLVLGADGLRAEASGTSDSGGPDGLSSVVGEKHAPTP